MLSHNEGVKYGMDIRQCLSEKNLAEFQFQQARGLRQTSFQRLILHRLADRFCIAREVIPQTEHIVTSLNLIRLVKTDETRVPKRLVGDVDLGVLVDYKNPLASKNHGAAYGGGGNYNGGGYTTLWNPNQQDDNLQPLSDQFTSATLDSAPPKKMVIMKRSSTDGTSSSHNLNKKESKSRNRKKNLADKERAYEEARARIFGVEKGDDDDGNDRVKESVGEGTEGADRTVDASEECNETGQKVATKQQLNPTVTEFRPLSSLSDSHHSTASMGSSEPAPNATEEGDESVEAQVSSANQQDQECTASSSPKESDIKQNVKHASKNKQKSSTSPSPSSTTNTKSSNSNKSTGKAVYRNRQQEEADPDFKRRSGPTYYTPASAVHQFAQNPYHAANPYNHVVNVAMGSSNPMTAGQSHHNLPHMQGQPYYGQQPYYNHLTAPQSPAFYGSGGYSQVAAGSQHVAGTKQDPVAGVKQNQPSLQATNTAATAVVGAEGDTSNIAAKPQPQPQRIKSKSETSPSVTAASIVIGSCNKNSNAAESYEQTLKPEDFPALR